MTDKLLPCPFCGGNADYLKVYAPKHEEGHDNRWRVRCEQGCGAMVPSFIGKDKAAAAWNLRAGPSPETKKPLRISDAENAEAGARRVSEFLDNPPPQSLSLSAKIVEFFETNERDWGRLSEPAQELLDEARSASTSLSPHVEGLSELLDRIDTFGRDLYNIADERTFRRDIAPGIKRLREALYHAPQSREEGDA